MPAAGIGRPEGVPFETVSKAVFKAGEKAPEIIQVAQRLELTREESRELFRRLEKQPERPFRNGLCEVETHRTFRTGPFKVDFYKPSLGLTLMADGSHPEALEVVDRLGSSS